MTRTVFRASFIVTLLATAACTQPPAQVNLRGEQSFGRSRVTPDYSFNTLAPAAAPAPAAAVAMPQNTGQTAVIQSVGVNDLPPPPPKANDKSAAVSGQKVNPWTGRPHFAEVAPTTTKSKSVTASSTFMWPVASRTVASGFGPKGRGQANDGITIAAVSGEPVWAAADGEVVYVDQLAGYGETVLIKHSGNKTTSYARLSRAIVDKYDRVKQGDIIGYVGSVGSVKEAQLHFSVHDGKTPVDPRKYLSTSVAGL